MVPNSDIKNASRGPARPRIAENPIMLEIEHFSASVNDCPIAEITSPEGKVLN